MHSLADDLPPEIARQIHHEWRKNEADYWSCRDSLLAEYQGLWVGFADGGVIVSGRSPVQVLHEAQETGRHPFVTCVGREKEPCRIRRTTFAYDMTYAAGPLPVIQTEFRRFRGHPGVQFSDVIPDTGSDATTLSWADCQHLQLDPAQGQPGVMAGVGGTATTTICFGIWARIDGQDYRCKLLVDFTGTERILGRDVLNSLEILFRGPSGEVVINP